MLLNIDPEFRDIIPPLTEEEYSGLEENLLTNGFNPAFPIILWKGHDVIVDGHNRYGICQKHNIPFETIEQEFETRYDVIAWILDNQLARRNVNNMTKTYLIGRRYLVEKKESAGRPESKNNVPTVGTLSAENRTNYLLGKQLGVSHNTIINASKFTESVDKIVQTTGITVSVILTGKIDQYIKEINRLANQTAEDMNKAVNLILEDKTNEIRGVDDALNAIIREKREAEQRERERQRRELEEQYRKEREEAAAKERERIRIEHEERVKRENERMEREREEREKLKLAEIERQKLLAAEKAKNEADRERIRKENEEMERKELAKMEEHFKNLQAMKQKNLEEQKRMEEERLKQAVAEKEKADREQVKNEIKDVAPPTEYDPYIKAAKETMGVITLNACKKTGQAYMAISEEELEESTTLNKNWEGNVWLDIVETSRNKQYIEKIVRGILDGAIKEAFVIAPNDTGAPWFKLVSQKAQAVVFPLDGEIKNHAIIYFGNNTETFMRECVKFGWGVILNENNGGDAI
jgi:hypothetical protein